MTDTAATEAPAEPAAPVPPAEPEAETELETEGNRTARQKVLDHLTDSEGPQSVEQILAGTGLNRNACEQAIFRAKKAEQIIWVAPGVYALAPPKPLPSSRNGHSNEEWVARIEAWQVNPASCSPQPIKALKRRRYLAALLDPPSSFRNSPSWR